MSSGPGTSSQPEHQLEKGPANLLASTPSSQPSSVDSHSSHCSPQVSPQTSPESQLCDLTVDNAPVEGCSPASRSSPHSDPQGSSPGGEEEVLKMEEVQETKTNKNPHLHCPTCKVTLNSSSQLDAHCSGAYFLIFLK